MQSGCETRSASVSTAVTHTDVLRCLQMEKSDSLRSGEHVGHPMSPLTLRFCYIDCRAVTHEGSISGHTFI
jgi:hypothetical protein